MDILKMLFNNEGLKQRMFERLAKTAKEKGIKTLVITLDEKGGFNLDTIKENEKEKVLISKEEYDFLLHFFNVNKIANRLEKSKDY